MNTKNYLKVIWLFACIAVLIWEFLSCGQQSHPGLRAECLLLAGGLMVVLTFPVGLLWVWLVSGAGYLLALFGIESPAGPSVVDLVVWVGFVLVGYFQWFVFLPWSIQKVRASKRGVTKNSVKATNSRSD